MHLIYLCYKKLVFYITLPCNIKYHEYDIVQKYMLGVRYPSSSKLTSGSIHVSGSIYVSCIKNREVLFNNYFTLYNSSHLGHYMYQAVLFNMCTLFKSVVKRGKKDF